MLEQAEQLPFALVAVDVVEELQGGLCAPAKEETREGVRRRPLQDVGDFRPEGLLLNAVLERIDPGDDEAVELLVTDVGERAVELVDVIGRRIPGVTPSRHAAHVRVGRDKVRFTCNIVLPSQRASWRSVEILSAIRLMIAISSGRMSCCSARLRSIASGLPSEGRKGWISWLWIMTGILQAHSL
jgi:hypothetical protein